MASSSRRSFLRKGALAALGLGIRRETSSLSASPRPRVGIVGLDPQAPNLLALESS